VDYKRRIAMLEDLRKREALDSMVLIRELAANPMLDEMKLFLTYKALDFRRANHALFAGGEYLPLHARGAYARHVCAFARRSGGQWAVAVAPRWTARLVDWSDTELVLPDGAPGEWREVFTGLIPASWRLADLLAEFPVALVANE
jgi:(1->4)-alpha-D-glucan 1-alpha-D-glucosylmutase